MKIDHPYYFAVGIGTKNRRNQWLEVYYPEPLSLKRPETIKAIRDKFVDKAVKDTVGITIELNPDETGEIEALFLDDPEQNRIRELIHQIKSSKHPLVLCLIDPRSDPAQVPDIYLRLHLLSHRLVKPHEINLNGIFGKLHNIAWTNRGAVDLSELRELQLEVRLKGEYLSVNSVDKFPKMTDYVVPAGVRIADTARVRLGAYIGEGTTIMHEGFVNFNAGTIGPNMIEGRVSAGVIIGEGTDLGGGCSTMGTLSGGNETVIAVGKNCLIGANAGLGIPLGDRCTIEAGLYLTGGSKVTVFDLKGTPTETVKASKLAGKSDLLFRRNSLNGAIECLTNKSSIELNEVLHKNN